MSSAKIPRALVAIAAVGYMATAALHSTGYDSIAALAQQGPADLRSIVPALWLAFSLDLLVLGSILAVVAMHPTITGARSIVLISGLSPLGAAILQLVYLGFVPPTAILLILAALTFVSAALLQRGTRSSTDGT